MGPIEVPDNVYWERKPRVLSFTFTLAKTECRANSFALSAF
jgi:hypothetical protein